MSDGIQSRKRFASRHATDDMRSSERRLASNRPPVQYGASLEDFEFGRQYQAERAKLLGAVSTGQEATLEAARFDILQAVFDVAKPAIDELYPEQPMTDRHELARRIIEGSRVRERAEQWDAAISDATTNQHATGRHARFTEYLREEQSATVPEAAITVELPQSPQQPQGEQ